MSELGVWGPWTNELDQQEQIHKVVYVTPIFATGRSVSFLFFFCLSVL